MIHFSATIEKFAKQGEKTGWTYIVVPEAMASELNPGVRKSYQVKGKLDEVPVKNISLLPMGEGDFIIPLNGELRKKIRKHKGDELAVSLELDKTGYQLNTDLIDCLKEDGVAFAKFDAFPRSHQNYYSKWVEAAKTDVTRAKRIAKIINAMHSGQSFAEMLKN